ncbi:hypothetical protein FF011L_27090 [Roseimaritima multifibrata]|uniref:Uncharacterized protein n=2 Tax=Roseimaritima multifibrata TaxID=1930274 RepID=A0A517MGC2_9BACT|nr:hypothetical protein FF011L_27090 [Roseimaritima multifibrata]
MPWHVAVARIGPCGVIVVEMAVVEWYDQASMRAPMPAFAVMIRQAMPERFVRRRFAGLNWLIPDATTLFRLCLK